MQLETKELAPYLPYRLMCQVKDLGQITTAELHSIYADGTCTFCNTVESEKGFDYVKPILRPLDDLDKDFLVFGSKVRMMPLEILNADDNFEDAEFVQMSKRYTIDEINSQSMRYKDFKKLFEWHFDVFGLIEKGLAVSINSQGVSAK